MGATNDSFRCLHPDYFCLLGPREPDCKQTLLESLSAIAGVATGAALMYSQVRHDLDGDTLSIILISVYHHSGLYTEVEVSSFNSRGITKW